MAFEEANDAVVSERSIFSEIRIIKVFSLFHGIHIWGSNTLGGKNKLITYTHTYTHPNESNMVTLAAHACPEG